MAVILTRPKAKGQGCFDPWGGERKKPAILILAESHVTFRAHSSEISGQSGEVSEIGAASDAGKEAARRTT